MDIQHIQENNISIITYNDKRLDASTAPEFKQKMEAIIDKDNTQIILNISKLTFMDSSSLGALVGILKYLGSRGKMILLGASGIVLDLFKLTRMDQVFTLVDDLNDAKAYFSN